MKKNLLLLLSLAILFAGCKNSDDNDPQIDDPTEDVQEIVFVSSEFESMILDSSRAHNPAKIDANGDDKISIEEAEAITALDVSGAAETPETTKATKSTDLTLTTLEDIVHFKNIVTLNCSNNELTALDLQANTKITSLNCSNNKLTRVDISGCTSLNDLDCSYNSIAAISVAANTTMVYFDCSHNELTELDLKSNKSLSYLDCSYNKFPVMDVTANSGLVYFDCSHNELTYLDLTSNDQLSYLDCSYNRFPTLDLTSNTSLTEVNCSNNQITGLDVSNLTNLTEGGLNCDNQTDASGSSTTITVTTNSEQSNILAEGTSDKVKVTTKDDTEPEPEPTPEPEPEPDYDTYVTINVTEPAATTDLPTSYQVVFNGTTSTLTSGRSLNLSYDYLRSGNYDAYIYNSLTDVTMSSEYVATTTSTTTSLSDHLYFGKDVVSVVADSSTSKSIEIAPMTRSLSIALNVTGVEVATITSIEVTISGLAQSWDCSDNAASGEAYSITETLTNVETTYSGNIITFGTNGASQKITIKITYNDDTVKSLESDVSSKFTTFNSDKSTAMTLSTDIYLPTITTLDWDSTNNTDDTINDEYVFGNYNGDNYDNEYTLEDKIE